MMVWLLFPKCMVGQKHIFPPSSALHRSERFGKVTPSHGCKSRSPNVKWKKRGGAQTLMKCIQNTQSPLNNVCVKTVPDMNGCWPELPRPSMLSGPKTAWQGRSFRSVVKDWQWVGNMTEWTCCVPKRDNNNSFKASCFQDMFDMIPWRSGGEARVTRMRGKFTPSILLWKHVTKCQRFKIAWQGQHRFAFGCFQTYVTGQIDRKRCS